METNTKKYRKYMSKNSYGYYYFVRRITNTKKIYKFSLKTKNCKIGKKIINNFLKNTEYIFRSIDLIDTNKLTELLDNYQRLSLIEDSVLEKQRHKDLTIKERDGGHPKSIKKNKKIFQDLVFDKNQEKIITRGRQVLRRTTPELQEYFRTIKTKPDIYVFMTKLIKRESQIIGKDLIRTENRFSNDINLPMINQQQIINTVELEPQLLTTKTKYEIIDEKINLLSKETKKKKDFDTKYKQIFNIILNVNDKQYLEDYTQEDFNDIFLNIVELPNGNKIKDIEKEFPLDFRKIIEVSKEKGIDEPQSFTTLKRKVSSTKIFFDWCLEPKRKYIRDNFLNDKEDYGVNVIKHYSTEPKDRTIFTKFQLDKMFNESDLYSIKNIYHTQPSMFLVPLLSLFSGTRLNEISGISVNEIKEENGIYYFDIRDTKRRRIKGKQSRRKIPIHSFLIDELKFLDYVKTLPENSLLFPDLENREHSSNGYGAAVSKVFNTVKTQFITEEDTEFNKIDFHSLRTTFITRLHIGEVEEALINGLSGHSQHTMSYKKYVVCELSRLKKEIEKLYIDDILDSLRVGVKKILELKFY